MKGRTSRRRLAPVPVGTRRATRRCGRSGLGPRSPRIRSRPKNAPPSRASTGCWWRTADSIPTCRAGITSISEFDPSPWSGDTTLRGTERAARGQMMRCIDHPTMLKDGSGWGAMCGVSAAYLAADGFTGAPAVTVEDARVRRRLRRSGDRVADHRDLISSPTPCAIEPRSRSVRPSPSSASTGSRPPISRPSTSSRSTRRSGSPPAARAPRRPPNTACRSPSPPLWFAAASDGRR